MTAIPTTPVSTETSLPPTQAVAETAVPVNTLTPINQDPVIITNDFTNARRGPGLAYEVSHVLSAGTTVAIVGRNETGSWWAIPGPGDGPGPVGWVYGAVVTIQGDLSHVPVLAAPPLIPDVPIMGNTNLLPADICTVAHPGPGDTGPLYVYRGPDKQSFAVVAQLGLDRWVTVIGRDNDWYHVQDDAGLTGWVPVAEVAHPGLCQADDGPGSIPLIEDPGSPPTDRCFAHRPGQFPPPDIHLGPGRQFALIARLGNWAEVLKTEVGWHQIFFGAGEVGWVYADDVELTGPCAASEPIPERIQFALGETSITLEGMLESPQRDFYLFRAFAGQQITIEIVSESNRANFAVSGLSDGQPYKRVEDELRSWSIELPTTQDYMLTVAAPVGSPTTGYRIFLTIEPLQKP
ncbi:MAG: SH3 domain-containing protein [Ardenticatenaceae bacterium]|nr:SH3 domain-containing protein [Anaerolineales bacterium]MCB8979859.1 SH3 domain-containing protein [Ardenticatenaceae bacterium]